MRTLLAGVFLCMLPGLALAQGAPQISIQQQVPTVAIVCPTAAANGSAFGTCTFGGGGGSGANGAAGTTGATAQYVQGVPGGTAVPTTDPNNASIGAAGTAPTSVTVGNTYTVARTLQFNCTTGGTVTFTEGGVGVTWMVSAGTTEIPHATTAVSSLGAAVCPNIYAHY